MFMLALSLFSSQFNCTYRKQQETSETLDRIVPGPGKQPVNNMTFNMELYNTPPPFNKPSRQAFYTVAQGQQVFVEVRWFFTHTKCKVWKSDDPAQTQDKDLKGDKFL